MEEERTRLLQDRLRAAVIKTAEVQAQKQGLTVSQPVMTALCDLTQKFTEQLAKELELFAHHANRKSVNMDDVILAARRNEDVADKLRELSQGLAKHKEQQQGEKKRRKAAQKDNVDVKPNGGSRRYTNQGSRKSSRSFHIVELPQQNIREEDSNTEKDAIEEQRNQVEGLYSTLDAIKKEIVNVQHETEKLSNNIVTAQTEFLELAAHIHKSTSGKAHVRELTKRLSSTRIRSESVFSTCKSATKGSARKPSKPVKPEEATSKQGWLWKTPLTPHSKPLKKAWTLKREGWAKRWFTLKGFILSYYRLSDSCTLPEWEEANGKSPRQCFNLSSPDTEIRNAEWHDLSKDTRKPPEGFKMQDESDFLKCLIFMGTEQGKLCLLAENSKVAASWLSLFTYRKMQVPYMDKNPSFNLQPDPKILRILECPESEYWDLSGCESVDSLFMGLSRLPSCPNVRGLSLARCKLDEEKMSKIQKHMALICHEVPLQHLDITENMIPTKSVAGFGLAISDSNTLKELIIDHNNLFDRGLEILAKSIWGFNRPLALCLEKLSVIDNGITDKGVKALADVLGNARQPIALSTLYLGENNIFDQGAAIMNIYKLLPHVTLDLESSMDQLRRVVKEENEGTAANLKSSRRASGLLR